MFRWWEKPEEPKVPEAIAEGDVLYVAVVGLESKRDSKEKGMRMGWAANADEEYALGVVVKGLHAGWSITNRMVMRIPLAAGLVAGEAEEVNLDKEQ